METATYDKSAAMLELDLDPSDDEDVEKFERDQITCNCDLDYQCYNPSCRERLEQEREYYGRLFSNPAVREHFRPAYGYEGGIRYKVEYEAV